ncbi:MAG: hypothetical protein LCH63_02850 [Candidatus Melainabacteria bacterium]|nr:hypothetical protein [Candidatus Melainabacteria bacterium]
MKLDSPPVIISLTIAGSLLLASFINSGTNAGKGNKPSEFNQVKQVNSRYNPENLGVVGLNMTIGGSKEAPQYALAPYPVVVKVSEGSPSQSLGITAGAHLCKIDGVDAGLMPLTVLGSSLRGLAGSEVTLEIEPPGAKSTTTFKIKRAPFQSLKKKEESGLYAKQAVMEGSEGKGQLPAFFLWRNRERALVVEFYKGRKESPVEKLIEETNKGHGSCADYLSYEMTDANIVKLIDYMGLKEPSILFLPRQAWQYEDSMIKPAQAPQASLEQALDQCLKSHAWLDH